MSSKKLVEKEHIQHILDQLFKLKLIAPEALKAHISDLENYINTNLLQTDKEALNVLKRLTYKQLQEASTQDEKNRLYCEYQKLKRKPY